MTRSGRVFLGAGLGTLLTLLGHPVSRPFFLGAILRPGAGVSRLLDGQPRAPRDPTSLTDAAEWIQIAAEKLSTLQGLTKKELTDACEVAGEAAKHDPTNAFWPQMLAVFQHEMHRDGDAMRNWMHGAAANVWDDYQSDRLTARRKALAALTHASMSWQYAYFYHLRSLATARLIEREARYLLSSADYVSPHSLEVRYSTVMNGARMRDGSRNVQLGEIGADIVELGAYPSELSGRRNPKKLLLGQNELFNRLNGAEKSDWAKAVQHEFEQNESWKAFSSLPRAEDEARDLGMTALLADLMPGTLLVVSLAGLLLWGLGCLCEVLCLTKKRFSFYVPLVVALGLGSAVQYLTSFNLAAISAALCGAFLAASPRQVRSRAEGGFGPAFGVVIGLLAIACGFSLGSFVFGYSAPALALLPYLAIPPEYFGGSPLFIGLAVLFFSMLFLVTPFWALVQRVPTPSVLAQGLRRFGATLAAGAFASAIVAGPIAIYADQKSGESLYRLLANEPIYYQLYYLQQNAHRT